MAEARMRAFRTSASHTHPDRPEGPPKGGQKHSVAHLRDRRVRHHMRSSAPPQVGGAVRLLGRQGFDSTRDALAMVSSRRSIGGPFACSRRSRCIASLSDRRRRHRLLYPTSRPSSYSRRVRQGGGDLNVILRCSPYARSACSRPQRLPVAVDAARTLARQPQPGVCSSSGQRRAVGDLDNVTRDLHLPMASRWPAAQDPRPASPPMLWRPTSAAPPRDRDPPTC